MCMKLDRNFNKSNKILKIFKFNCRKVNSLDDNIFAIYLLNI